MLPKSIKIVTDYCDNCNKQYIYGVPSSCQSCSQKEIKAINPLTFAIKELAYSCILLTPFHYIVFFKFGLKIELICLAMFIYGQYYNRLLRWLMRKF